MLPLRLQRLDNISGQKRARETRLSGQRLDYRELLYELGKYALLGTQPSE